MCADNFASRGSNAPPPAGQVGSLEQLNRLFYVVLVERGADGHEWAKLTPAECAKLPGSINFRKHDSHGEGWVMRSLILPLDGAEGAGVEVAEQTKKGLFSRR